MNKKITALLCLFFSFGVLNAQNSGDLDTSFGNNGKVNTDIGQADFNVNAQATQADGKIVLAGQFNNFNNTYGFLIRLNADGTLDSSFNGTGRIINENVSNFEKLIIQSDGKILVGGGEISEVTLVRYSADGTLDATFGNDGSVVTDVAEPINMIYFVDFALQSDGKIVVLSYYNVGTQNYRLTRINSDGTIDSTFGTNGATVTDIGGSEIVNSIAVLANDRIVVNGVTIANSTQIFVAKYTATGILDTSFNTTGTRVFTFTGTVGARPSNIAVQSDGKLLFANEAYTNGTPRVHLVRLNVNGSSDTSFDGDGMAIVNAPNDFVSNGGVLKILPSGKYMFFTGTETTINTINYRKVSAFRFNSNGSADTTFDTDGQTTYTINNFDDDIADFSIAGDGNLVFSGNTNFSFFQDRIFLCKLNANGSLNTAFSNDGKVEIFFPFAAYDEIRTAKLQADGKIVAGGVAFFNDELRTVVLRYNSNGTLDTSFSDNGILRLFNQGPFYNINDIEITASGKILIAAGEVYSYVLQLNADGTVDTSFGDNGFVLFSSNFTNIRDIEVLSNGKILLAGNEAYTIGTSFSANFKLTKLNANGTFDNTFGTAGTSNAASTTADQEGLYYIKALTSGKIVATGTINNGNDVDVVVFRYNSNGSLDNTFNGNGFASFGGPEYDVPTGLVTNANGKITVCSSIGNDSEPQITRLNSNGEFDTTFSTDGNVNFSLTEILFAEDITTDNDGKLLVSGSAFSANENDIDFTVLRLNDNGTLDNTFANNGQLKIPFSNSNDFISTLLVSGNTAIAAGSAGETQGTNDFALAKFFINTVLNTSEFESNKTSFYPNPASEMIMLNETVTAVEIFAIDGKFIPVAMNGNQIDVSTLPNGVYLVKSILDNKTFKTEKLVVKH